MNRQAWRDFFITVFFLGIAFLVALLSSVAADQRNTQLATVAAAVSLVNACSCGGGAQVRAETSAALGAAAPVSDSETTGDSEMAAMSPMASPGVTLAGAASTGAGSAGAGSAGAGSTGGRVRASSPAGMAGSLAASISVPMAADAV